ncbi:gliding motility-associated C-terminal domain-containing protein [Algoriphagus sp. H41]|uniref:Gliding motility-associated C-terminal domain-containing protein n=1 Tax=Algoriphagus oliviformis TaxID=2811231 RepID=A0ABS3C4Q8_9BACT|nr:gliding motility-associated C-terminal domain-containing protein [Algoriphagus oliviformis]MBN7811589.1 gliding motility-associated C-terminal domain-containing protein [Algoriphagus oliviformis]
MKSSPISIRFILIFASFISLSVFGISRLGHSQGFNENEWIFGNCDSGSSSYLSFGKGNNANVQTLPNSILLGKNNSALAIDPITGQVLFQTNGELVYDYSQQVIQGVGSGLNGNFTGHQQVATGFLEYDPEGDKLFYIFYISPGGQLQYAVVDMNAQGQATGNERPLGEVTVKDQVIGPASGAVLVVKTSASPSYLISFSGGNLISNQLQSTQGSFSQTGTQAIPFTPKAIIFDEENSQLILIPENAGDDIQVVPFDTSSGSFGTPTPISGSGGSDEIGGADYSPDDSYIYFSRGNQLFRVPSADLAATPEEVPLTAGLHQVYDVKTGPDGQLYYIYEEVDGGPQLIGRVTNPDESDLSLLSVEEDPFAGTDFCGTVFPVFAPNADISPTVDFTWDPDAPCSNNPVQLTSVITPENYQPVSFNWEFSPPLTDSDGNPLPADYAQEHFLIPQDAAQGTSVSVTLTVEFADGSTQNVNKTIPLTENNLEANFSPSDTTLCMSCIDLEPLLQAQSSEGEQGGEAPGAGGDNYEYFWSNKRDRGWIGKEANEVCLPGLYWVLVREPGSQCYAYAEIRVKIWDLPDQSNNIWYFGDGAGLDFNPDPNDSTAPTPRPIAQRHPQNIPAGTTTISDQAGQVLFFTDGQSVWDLNGNLMENGDDIGGSNTSSQSVIAVGVPQQPTLFYLFTTQASAGGTNSVSFSMVDIKSENTTGVGNVVTKNNFLFSPSTEHSAAFSSGDTTWVMYHELGNNTFRAYPVSGQGIGQPVMSSVGSSHGFNSGVGAMKFSPDGTKLAVTISEGGCNKTEIFEFDQQTGKLTEYARLDLGCDGDIYGLEFSESSDRILVSYRNGGPGVEEFNIKAVDNDDPNAGACPSCFGSATTRAQREACILSTRKTVGGTSGLNLGALQIASDGQIYVAVVGDNRIGQIQVGTGCTGSSTFNQDAVEPMPGTSNLGLPSFVQNSGSSIPEPALSMPPRLCLDPELGAGALLEGGGEPDIDSYFWTITHEDGTVVRSDYGGPGDQFQTLDQIFNTPGVYTVELRVDRCGDPDYFTAEGEIEVVAPPALTLASDATLCAGNPVTLTAIDGYDPAEGLYDFQWTNAAGQVFGDENSNSIEVTEESIYTVQVSFRLPDGLGDDEALLFETCPATAEVFVGPAFEFDLDQTATEVCYEETSVTFAPNTPISGEWYYELNGSGVREPLGEFFELELWIPTLPGPGQYEIIFVTQDPILEGCTVEKKVDLLVNELPVLTAAQTNPATDCTTADGSFDINLQSDASEVRVPELSLTFSNQSAGSTIPVTNLLPGVYTIEAENSSGCFYSASVTVENQNPPAPYQFSATATDETCSATGVEPGKITISFLNGNAQTGTYTAVRQGDGQTFTGPLPSLATFDVDLPFGEYLIEVADASGCAIPDPTLYSVAQKLQVIFSVPTQVTACESFTFAPTGPNALTYLVTDGSGATVSPDASGEFTLTQSGLYTVRGEDPNGVDCPRELQMQVSLTQPIDFELSEPIVDCQTGVRYEAILNNVAASDVVFIWKDDLGVIVGRRQTFVPSRDGDYTLEVQPASGGLCPSTPISFTAEVLGEAISVNLDVIPFCVDQTSTTITVEADMERVANIEWYLVSGGTRTRQFQWDDLPIIEVSAEGTYEALLRSEYGCELGRANAVVAKSTIIPPVVPTELTICAIEGVTTSIAPGDYDNYSWLLDGQEVSQDAIFTPTLPGTYELRVSDNLGCEYVASFVVQEDCRLLITYPNGVVLGDPSRNFILYANDFIDDVEVFIFNRWGELIFYCEHENLEPRQPFCPWDGIVNGKFVPNGTYAVVVKFSSRAQNITIKETRAITIIQ